jgi:hypothetical protein
MIHFLIVKLYHNYYCCVLSGCRWNLDWWLNLLSTYTARDYTLQITITLRPVFSVTLLGNDSAGMQAASIFFHLGGSRLLHNVLMLGLRSLVEGPTASLTISSSTVRLKILLSVLPCWNKTTILTLEEACFTSPQESPTGALMSESNAACFFRSSRNCALWFAPEGQTINQDLYLEVLRHLQDAVWRKWPEMWTAGSWLLHPDNSPTHTALSSSQFLAKHAIPTIPHPPIHLTSPLPTFFYSLNSKLPLKEEGCRQRKTSSLMQRMTWKQYHKHPSNNASESGKGGGRGALLCKGTILKGIILSKL